MRKPLQLPVQLFDVFEWFMFGLLLLQSVLGVVLFLASPIIGLLALFKGEVFIAICFGINTLLIYPAWKLWNCN